MHNPGGIEGSLPGEQKKRSAIWATLAAIAISAVWFLPVNFVRLDDGQSLVYKMALALSAVAAVVVVGWGARSLLYVIMFFMISASIALLLGRAAGTVLIVLLQVCAGYVVMRMRSGRIYLQILLATASVFSLVTDWVLSRHVYAALFPSQYFEYISGTGFRARGILGQPVPAAHLTISLLAYLYVLARTLTKKRRIALRGALVLMAGAVVVTTGTRSAIVLVCALALILVGETLKASDTVAFKQVQRVMLAIISLGIVLVLSADKLATLRLFDFNSLPNSDSYEVRSGALSTVMGLSSECDPCVIFGHGRGALAERLHGGAAISGVGTLDNMYLTTYWDFGLMGIAAFLLVGIAALKRFAHGIPDINRAGAVGLLSLLIAFAFFDGMYIASGAFLFGLFLASMEDRDRPARIKAIRAPLRATAIARPRSIS